jgi:hypothetical protein
MKMMKNSGAAMAVAAAALLASGMVGTPSAQAAEKGKCIGANSCKGSSACKSASSACKGHNACKGQGWLDMTKAECDAAKGKHEPVKG